LSSETTDRRIQWLLATVLLFFGIFAASTRGPIPSHVPQCVGARAIGAQTSLASANRESRPVSFQVLSFLVAAIVLRSLIPQFKRAHVIEPAIRSIVQSSLCAPALLRRPPPAVSFA
jgi:hypothetical protein